MLKSTLDRLYTHLRKVTQVADTHVEDDIEMEFQKLRKEVCVYNKIFSRPGVKVNF